jgi:hypothetical protein
VTGVAFGVNPEQAALQHFGGNRLLAHRAIFAARATQHDLDVLHQQPLQERLPDEVVRAHLEGEQFVNFFLLGGKKITGTSDV